MSARWVTWIDDEQATVELVSQTDGHVVAKIESKSGTRELRFDVALRRSNGEQLLRTPDGRSHQVWVGPESGHGHARTISVGGRSIEVRARRELDAWLATDNEVASGAVSVAMPGRVVKLLAKVGDTVEKGQALLIVEAMKMENEVKAKKAGVVQVIHAVEGGSVEGGKVLMEIA